MLYLLLLATAIWIVPRYIAIPFLMKRQFKLSADPAIEILDWDAPVMAEVIPDGTLEYRSVKAPAEQTFDLEQSNFLRRSINEIEQLGFGETVVSRNIVEFSKTNATSVGAHFINRDARETALAQFNRTVTGPINTCSSSITFGTDYQSGRSIATSNTTDPQFFRYAPDAEVNLLPSITNTDELLQIHRWLVARRQIDEPRKLPDYGDSFVEWYKQIQKKLLDRQVEIKHFWLDTTTQTYRLTTRGAFFIAWSLVFPLKQRRAREIRRREQEILQAFRASS